MLEKGNVVPTYLSVFIDCHSRFTVEARYYFRENLDVLIDSLIRALSTHGAPLAALCGSRQNLHGQRPESGLLSTEHQAATPTPQRPAPGGLIERLIQTIQVQLEAEIRAGDILTLEQLNRCLSAMAGRQLPQNHTQRNQTEPPEQRYQKGLTVIRQVDMSKVIESFMQTVDRTVNRTFSDIQLNKRFYRVDPKLRGDRVQVKYDPFSSWDTVQIYSLARSILGHRHPLRS